MKGYLSNENGEIIIENEVIAQYAGHAALECFGIVGMSSVRTMSCLLIFTLLWHMVSAFRRYVTI